MKIQWKKLLISLAIPLGVGVLAGLLTGGMAQYKELRQPPLAPPGWVFPVVWTILYLLMGYASYRIWVSSTPRREKAEALKLYGAQLAINFLWPLVFFGGKMYLTAFIVLAALWVAIVVTMRRFMKLDETAGDLLIPYLLWVSFAAYLNLGVFLLN